MTERVERSGLGRSARALLAGFLATALLSLGTDLMMHATGVYPPWGEPMSDGLFVWATVYRAAFTVLGGFITARLAPRNPMTHVFVGAALGMVAGSAGAIATWNQGPEFGPKWYPVMLVVTGLPCVLAGGVLAGARKKMATAQALP